MEFGGGYRLVDLQKNLAVLGLEVPTIHISSINGATNTSGACGTYDKEVLMDIYIASSVAPGAQLVVYFAPPDERGWYDAIMAAIHPDAGEPVPTVLSISWRLCDGDVPDLIQVFATVAGVDAISSGFQDAALLGSNGPTIFVSSGDAGSQANQGRAYVHYPASDPWVTACGGTEIGNVNGSVFDERTWESSGGGVSDHFNVPFYQSSAGINPVSANGDGRRGRGVPDVAGNASQASGYNVQCGDSSFTASQTSAVPPLYAGLLARVNAALGRQIGFLNPVLYANGSTVCRDLKDGICNGQTPPFYVSGPGWDLVTGWGSIDGLALLRVLRSSKSERRTTRCSQRAKYNR
jgi:kumamolisin